MNIKKDDYKKDFIINVEESWVRIQARRGMVVSADQLISTLKELYSMDAYRDEKWGSLWDFRGCKSDLNYDKVQTVKNYMEGHFNKAWKHKITAFVVDQDLLYGLARMYEMVAGQIPTAIRIFKDMDQAETWLREESIKCDLGDQA